MFAPFFFIALVDETKNAPTSSALSQMPAAPQAALNGLLIASPRSAETQTVAAPKAVLNSLLQELVEAYETRRSAKALDVLLQQKRPPYRGAGPEIET